jgi:hypothetical protein
MRAGEVGRTADGIEEIARRGEMGHFVARNLQQSSLPIPHDLRLAIVEPFMGEALT